MDRSYLLRLRWTADDALSAPEGRAVLARAFAYLYGAGASLVLVTLALPHDSGRHLPAMVTAVAMAYLVVALLVVRFDRLPRWLFLALPTLGTVLVSAVLIGGGGASVAAYAMMYFWVVLAAHFFFDTRVGVFNTAVVSVLYGVVLAVTPHVRNPEVKWLTATGAFGVSGMLMSLLRWRNGTLFTRLARHVDTSDALARLSRTAVDPEHAGTLTDAVMRFVREHLGADCASVLLLRPDGTRLEVVAAEGWRRRRVGTDTAPVTPGSLTGRALAADGAQRSDDHPELTRTPALAADGVLSSVHVPLRGGDRVYGLLAAHSRREDWGDPGVVGALESVAGVLAGAMDRAAADARLRHQAYHDELTGQPNRRLFMERLEAAVARARQTATQVAVLFCDLDNFKVVNDSLGHQVGDAVLIGLAPRLCRHLGAGVTVARFGGDEFVVLCEGLDSAAGGLVAAERVHAALEEPFDIDGAVYRLTASVGVAVADPGAGDAQSLLRDADAALARAKASGRNRTAVYDAGMHQDAVSRLRLESALRSALSLDQLRLVYQPIVDLDDGRIVAAEALLRWRHPELGDVSPAEMIPVAEETGLIVAIGDWVLREACTTAARWRAAYGALAPAVTVNVSPRQLVERGFADRVQAILREHRLGPGNVVVEITESVLIDEASGPAERLERLRSMGTRLALDDFGTGYSSLAYLQRFAVDTIKIDRSFVATIDAAAGGDTIVGAVLGLATGLGCRVVAEGIETAGQLRRLRELGCELGQGYLFSRPIPLTAMDALLVSGGTIATAPETLALAR